MQECDKFRVHFSSYIEGELLSEERQALEAHLAVCTDCSEAIYQIKIIRRSLQSLPPITTSSHFERQLQDRIARLNNTSPWMGPLLNLKHNWKIPAIGSAVASIVILGVLLLSPPQPNTAQSGNTEFRTSVRQSVAAPTGIPGATAAPAKALTSPTETQLDSTKNNATVPRTAGRPVQLVGD